jgi:polyhydroxyalkanoate synthesis regulator phasin
MKTKTLLELITLSSSLYYLAKDAHFIDKFNELSKNSKNSINQMSADSQLTDDGTEMEFVEKLAQKTNQLKEELEEKIEELVSKLYKKINVAHLDEIRALHEKVEKSDIKIALLEARFNRFETNK